MLSSLFKKQYIIFCIFCIIFMCCIQAPHALARTHTYEKFIVDIPRTWQIKENQDTLTFIDPSKQCAVNIAIATHTSSLHEGSPIKDLASSFSRFLKGTAPQRVDGGYEFSFSTPQKVQGMARFTMLDDQYTLISVLGNCKDLSRVLTSIVLKKPNKTRLYPIINKQ